MEPQGHSRRLAELVGRDGASYNPLSMAEMQINPLDPIFDDINDQKAYQTSIYRLMLKQIDPERRLSMQEAGLLDKALGVLYSGLSDPLRTPARYVPRLEQLCRELRRQGARTLAEDLQLNYVEGSMGEVFNQATNTDVALEADVVTYDFKDIPTSSRTLIYTLVLGRIQRIIRATGRMRRRVVAIDEFGWLAQEPMLAEVVAMWIKTFRTFGCGIWVAEQDLIRLTGGMANGDLSGHSIIGNSVFQLFFNHEPSAADVVVETFPNVMAYRDMLETFPRPQETGLSEAVLRLPDGVYHTYMLLSDRERNILIGS
jgi:type IV secretory pathway VirB4 component